MGDPDRAESLQPPDARVRLAVPAERVFDFDQDVESCDLAGDWVQAISCVTTGMISQNILLRFSFRSSNGSIARFGIGTTSF